MYGRVEEIVGYVLSKIISLLQKRRGILLFTEFNGIASV